MYWIARNNELGAAICDHLRKGNWLLDWITARLRQKPASAKVRVSLAMPGLYELIKRGHSGQCIPFTIQYVVFIPAPSSKWEAVLVIP
jgi:hypothetical protein